MKTTASQKTVLNAIEKVNKERGYSIEADRLDTKGKYTNFTLKTKSKIPGSRTSHSGRNLPKASWHAHGFVMDEIFLQEPDAVIYSGARKIYKNDPWEDQNIGSIMSPVMFSDTSVLSGKE